jgi:hypothetical protein
LALATAVKEMDFDHIELSEIEFRRGKGGNVARDQLGFL